MAPGAWRCVEIFRTEGRQMVTGMETSSWWNFSFSRIFFVLFSQRVNYLVGKDRHSRCWFGFLSSSLRSSAITCPFINFFWNVFRWNRIEPANYLPSAESKFPFSKRQIASSLRVEFPKIFSTSARHVITRHVCEALIDIESLGEFIVSTYSPIFQFSMSMAHDRWWSFHNFLPKNANLSI